MGIRCSEDVLDTILDFVPIVGGGKDIYQGIQDGNGWMVALGVGSIILDVATLGSASLVKGVVKTGIKAGGRSLTKKAAKSAIRNSAKGGGQGVNRIYSARELLRRAAEPGPFHNFHEAFNKTIFQNGTKTITPNYFNIAKPGLSNTNILYKYPGTVNGAKGFFEIGVRPSLSGNTEVIIHRFINPIR